MAIPGLVFRGILYICSIPFYVIRKFIYLLFKLAYFLLLIPLYIIQGLAFLGYYVFFVTVALLFLFACLVAFNYYYGGSDPEPPQRPGRRRSRMPSTSRSEESVD